MCFLSMRRQESKTENVNVWNEGKMGIRISSNSSQTPRARKIDVYFKSIAVLLTGSTILVEVTSTFLNKFHTVSRKNK